MDEFERRLQNAINEGSDQDVLYVLKQYGKKDQFSTDILLKYKDKSSVIKEVLSKRQTTDSTTFSQEQLDLLDQRIKHYLDTLSDRLVEQNTNEKTISGGGFEKVGKQKFSLELLRKKSITATSNVAGGNEVGLMPWYMIGAGGSLFEYIRVEEIDAAGVFKNTQISNVEFTKRSATTDSLGNTGTLTSNDVVINEFDSKIESTLSAVEDVESLERSIQEYFLDRFATTLGKEIVDSVIANATNSVKSGVNATASNAGVPAKATVISKVASMITKIKSEYLMGTVVCLNPDVFAVLLDALTTGNAGGFQYDPEKQVLHFGGGFPVIPSSHIATASKTTDVIGFAANLMYSSVLGLRRNLDVRVALSTEDPSQVNYLARGRFAVASRDVQASSKMLASA